MSILCTMVGASFAVAAAPEVIRAKKGITAVGNAQISTAQSQFGGSSYLGDGTGDYLIVDNTTGNFTYGTNNFTVELWFRINSTASSVIIWDQRSSATQNNLCIYFNSDGARVMTLVNGSNVITSTAISANTWYHLAYSRSGNDHKMFLNGTQAGSTWTNSVSFGSTNPRIGAASTDGSASLNGYIDEVRVSNSARYTANFTPSTTAFVNDENTLLLIHADGTNASTVFEDDNGVRAKRGIRAINQAKVSTAQSQFGGASAEFDGNDDHLLVSTLPTNTGDFTFECWGRFDILPWNQTLGGGSYMMAYTANSTNYLLINRSGAGSQVNFQIATGNRYGSFTKSGVNLAINTWYHIAIVRNSGVWKAFFNGTELTTFNNDSNFTNSGRTEDVSFGTLGRFIDSRGSWDGYMDEIRVSNSARYTGDFTPSTAPFVNDANTQLLIHCDGTNNSTFFEDDNGVRTKRGISAVGNAQISTAQSKFNGASALFDGTGDFIQLENSSNYNFGSNNFTVECWVRATNFTSFPSIMGMAVTGTYGGWCIQFNTSGVPFFQCSTNNSSINITPSGPALSTGTWSHLAVVRNGDSIRVYKDGVGGTAVTISGSIITSSANLIFGDGYGVNPTFVAAQDFNGYLDEIRISNVARYTANFTAPTEPFVNDDNTVLLIHTDGTNASTVFTDDNGVTPNYEY